MPSSVFDLCLEPSGSWHCGSHMRGREITYKQNNHSSNNSTNGAATCRAWIFRASVKTICRAQVSDEVLVMPSNYTQQPEHREIQWKVRLRWWIMYARIEVWVTEWKSLTFSFCCIFLQFRLLFFTIFLICSYCLFFLYAKVAQYNHQLVASLLSRLFWGLHCDSV